MPSVLPGLKIQVVSGRIFCGTHIADDIAPLRFLPRSYQGVLFDSPVSARGRGIYSAGMVEAVLGEAKNAPAVSRGITKENQKIKTLAFLWWISRFHLFWIYHSAIEPSVWRQTGFFH